MKSAPFKLHRPTTVEEAVTILAEVAEEGGLVLAGGQSLVPMMALRVAYPPHLVDINAITSLNALEEKDGRLAIGATVRHGRFHEPVEEGCLGRLLAAVSRHIAHYPIRMRGTFCGSLAHADPASEWCLVSTTLDADIHLTSASGQRRLSASEFLAGAMVTAREPDEMLVAASLPLLPDACFGFYEFNRRAGDFALGMSLAVLELQDGKMSKVRVGLGGIEEVSRRMTAAEELLEGKAPTDALFREAGRLAAAEVEPMEDPTTPAEYRRDLTEVVIHRALKSALGDLK